MIPPTVWLHLRCGGLVEVLPNTFTDIIVGTILANLVTDAFRKTTKADVGLAANGMMHARLMRGKSGVLTGCDVFVVVPLGAGVVDTSAGRSGDRLLHRPGAEASARIHPHAGAIPPTKNIPHCY